MMRHGALEDPGGDRGSESIRFKPGRCSDLRPSLWIQLSGPAWGQSGEPVKPPIRMGLAGPGYASRRSGHFPEGCALVIDPLSGLGCATVRHSEFYDCAAQFMTLVEEFVASMTTEQPHSGARRADPGRRRLLTAGIRRALLAGAVGAPSPASLPPAAGAAR